MPSSEAGAQQVSARSEWLDQQIDQAISGNTAGDAPWGVNERARDRVILSTDGNDPEADRYSRLAELEYRSQRAAASGEMSVFDIEDAELGGRTIGSPYAMDTQRTLNTMKGYADTWAVVKDQIAERDAMLQAQDAQAATTRSQREADNVASWRELEAQARSGDSAAASTGNAMFVSEGGAAFGNRQLSVRERTQTDGPEWRQAVISGFRGETQSVMVAHNEREAAKLGGLLRFGFDMTPVGAGYNYVENTAEGRPFSALLSVAPYAIPGAVVAGSAERSALRTVDEFANRLATRPDEAMFWSGLGRGGDVVAANVAKQEGRVTLEMTRTNRGVELPTWDPGNAGSVSAWRQASHDFAAGASGNVRVLQGNAVRVDSFWAKTEFPALKANPNVKSITSIDQKTGSEVLLWSR